MLFSELYKIMVKKVTSVGFRGEAIAPTPFGYATTAALLSVCVAYVPPKPGLRVCFGATVSYHVRHYPLWFDVLRANMSM